MLDIDVEHLSFITSNLLQNEWMWEKDFEVYCLVFFRWIELWNSITMKPLSYIIAYMFDKSTKNCLIFVFVKFVF